MSFDYPYTCPEIDREIAQAKSSIEERIVSIVEEACPLMPSAAINEYAKKEAEYFYRDIEDIFEKTRSTNDDMRKSAERQISALEDRIGDLESEIEQLKREAA